MQHLGRSSPGGSGCEASDERHSGVDRLAIPISQTSPTFPCKTQGDGSRKKSGVISFDCSRDEVHFFALLLCRFMRLPLSVDPGLLKRSLPAADLDPRA